MKVVLDLETNGLFPDLDTIWIAVAVDQDTKEKYLFSDYDPELAPMSSLVKFLEGCTEIVAHNGMTFDFQVLRKLLGWDPQDTRLIDTMIYSQVLNYKRFGGRHSLGVWGNHLKHKKPEHEDWTQYSPEMKVRCVEDVLINLKVWEVLKKELSKRSQKDKLIKGIKSEHSVSYFVGWANSEGWPFDIDKARSLLSIIEKEMEDIKAKIEPKLKLKIAPVDPKGEFKSPAYIKTGNYAARTANWFELDPSEGNREEEHRRPIFGDYCRVQAIQPDIGSLDSVREYLYSLGWEPWEWNYTRQNGRLVKTTPKLDEESLKRLPNEDGQLISRYLSIRARHSIVSGWIENNYRESTGRLHGDCFVVGTPTFRVRHKFIANIPSGDTAYAHEIRSLFVAKKGYKVVGADSAGNQARGLCHYLDSDDYTKIVTEGDVHTYHQGILEKNLGAPIEGDGRDKTKKFYYALIFAAGAGKLALIVLGKRDTTLGQRLKDIFFNNIPGLGDLVTRLNNTWYTTKEAIGNGYIIALDGRPVFCEDDRRCLNYLLQSTEKITCSLATQWFMEKAKEHNLDWQPLIFYHDEIQLMVREDQAELAQRLAAEAFEEGPKRLGVTIMDGSADVGNNWAETH